MLGRGRARDEIRRMAEQEKRHLAAFDALLRERTGTPTALHPVWHVAGYVLGAATALLGERAAMACTVAVEEVIDEHYRDQAELLGDTRPGAEADDRGVPRRRTAPPRQSPSSMARPTPLATS